MKGLLSGEERTDHCSCIKGMGIWGDLGWHQTERYYGQGNPALQHVRLPDGRRWVVIVALERCPAYMAARRRNQEAKQRAANPMLNL